VAGCFIVLEGGEGSGKSTQLARLAERVRAEGRQVVQTFEPGATPRGAALRRLLLDDDQPLDARAELLLMAADRAQHVAEVVAPARAAGAVVVCDRFAPSTLVYQGVARGLGAAEVAVISDYAAAGTQPDLVIVLDVDEATASQRRPTPADRLEREGSAFHATVRQAYRDLAAEYGWVVIDGSGSPDAVADAVWTVVAPLLRRA
jgi:dTMP kinase